MRRFLDAQGKAAVITVLLLLSVALAAIFYFGALPIRSWDMPDVSIWQPSDGDEVSGSVSVGATYAVDHGQVHSVQLLIDGAVVDTVAVHERSGSHVFVWNSTTVADGQHTIAVRAHEAAPQAGHYNEDSIILHVANAACGAAADCDDADAYTEDICLNPGQLNAVCVYNPVACLNAGDCNDEDELTLDACNNPGAGSAACAHTAIACNINADCDDDDEYSTDVCQSGGTLTAACVHNPVACLNAADCDDEVELTLDACANPGTATAACTHTAIACNTGADCNDGDDYTEDICTGGGTAGAACSANAIACLTDADCGDGDTLTVDTCSNQGTAAAACVNTPVACAGAGDCDDDNALSIDACANPGTATAACTHAAIACNTSADCDDNNEYTLDQCSNGGATSAACANTPIACLNAADCDDGDALTRDTCTNPGTAAASCVHDPLACNVDTDCDDDNALSIDACANSGTTSAACTHTTIACVTDSDCDDSDNQTSDACVNPGTTGSSCTHMDLTPEPLDLTLDVVSPEDEVITNQTSISISGTATPGAAVTVNGAALSVDAAGVFSVMHSLQEGSNSLTIKACLAADCLTETRTVVADTQAPEIGDAVVDDDAVFIAVRDNTGGSGLDTGALVVLLDGDELPASYDQAHKALRFAPGDVEPGAHAAVVSAADLAGNTAQRTVTVVSRPHAGLKIIIKKVPGRVFTEDGSTDAGSALPSDPEQTYDAVDDGAVSALAVASGQVPEQAAGVWSSAKPPRYKMADTFLQAVREQFGYEKPARANNRGFYCAPLPVPDSSARMDAAQGIVEAEIVLDEGVAVDEQSIQVSIDGQAIDHTYDSAARTITAAPESLDGDTHTLEVMAADTEGNESVATTAFGVDPNVITFTIENYSQPGQPLALGDQFRVYLTLDGDPGGTPWFKLYNASDPVYADAVNSHQIGNQYEMTFVSAPAPDSGDPYIYEFTGWFYTSWDEGESGQPGEDAQFVGAALPLDAEASQYTVTPMTLPVANPPVRPLIDNLQVVSSNAQPRTIALNDTYSENAQGSPGMQQVFTLFVNLDSLTAAMSGSQQTNPIEHAVPKSNYNPGDWTTIFDFLEEAPYGGGNYVLPGGGAAELTRVSDVNGQTARVLLPLACSPLSGIGCVPADVLYVDEAPQITSVALKNISGSDPNEPFNATARNFRIEVAGALPAIHSGHAKAVLINADRAPSGPLAIAENDGLRVRLTGELQGFYPQEIAPGVMGYVIEGTVDSLTDGDGNQVSSILAVFTTADFYDGATSNALAVTAAPKSIPTIITHLDAQPVDGGGAVTSSNPAPAIAGTAPPGADVKIYELTPDGQFGGLTSAAAPAAVFVPGVGTFGDSFDDGSWEDRWDGYADSYGTFSFTETDRLLVEAGPMTKARLFSRQSTPPFGSGFTMAADLEFPSSGNPSVNDSDLAIQFDVLGRSKEIDHLELSARMWLSSGTNALTVSTGDGSGFRCEKTRDMPLSPDTPYRLEMRFSAVGGLSFSINGVDWITDCAMAPFPDGVTIQPVLALNTGDNAAAITWDALTTDIPLPGGYRLSGPALGIDNNPAYDVFNTGSGMLHTTCSQFPKVIDDNVEYCIDGDKNVYAMLIRLFNFKPGDVPLMDEALLTLYSGGTPGSEEQDQVNTAMQFLDILDDIGAAEHYQLDAVGIPLSAAGNGQNFEPGPMGAQHYACKDNPGQPGTLTWDAGMQQYLASPTSLQSMAMGVVGQDVIWGLTQSSEPNFVTAPGTPVWWTDPAAGQTDNTIDITAGIIRFNTDSGPLTATMYALPALFDQLTGWGVEILDRADGALEAHGTGENYVWRQDILAAGNLAPASLRQCGGYGRTLIATATAGENGDFAAVNTTALTSSGSHLLLAVSADHADADKILSQSSIATYTIGQSGGNPPAIAFDAHADYFNTTRPTLTATITDTGGGVGAVSCEPAPACSVTYDSGSGIATITFNEDLPQGQSTITLIAQSTGTPVLSAQETTTVFIDTVPPATDLTPVICTDDPAVPENCGASFDNDTTLFLTYNTVADPEPGSGIDAYYAGTIPAGGDCLTLVAPENIADPDVDTDTISGQDGAYWYCIIAADKAGNTTAAHSAIIIDTSAPVITITNAAPLYFRTDNPFSLQSAIQDDNLDDYCSITITDGKGHDYFPDCYPSAPIDITWNGTDTNTAAGTPFPNGPYTITIRVMDLAGNIAEQTVTATLDNEPPVVAFTMPTDGSNVDKDTPTTAIIYATDNDQVQDASVTLAVNGGAPLDTTPPGPYYTAILDISSFSNGAQPTLTASVADRAGNTVQRTISVTVRKNPGIVETATLANQAGGGTLSPGGNITASFELEKQDTALFWWLVDADRWDGKFDSNVFLPLIMIPDPSQDGRRNREYTATLKACAAPGQPNAARVRIAATSDGFASNIVLSPQILTLDCTEIPQVAAPEILRPVNGATINSGADNFTVKITMPAGLSGKLYLQQAADTDGGSPDPLTDPVLKSVIDSQTTDGNVTFEVDTALLGAAGMDKTIYAVAANSLGNTSDPLDPDARVTFNFRDNEKPVITDITVTPNPFSPGNPSDPSADGVKDVTIITAHAQDDNLTTWDIKISTTDTEGNPAAVIFRQNDMPTTGPDSLTTQWDGFRVRNNGTRILQPDGLYYIELRAKDQTGKRSDWATTTVRIDMMQTATIIAAIPAFYSNSVVMFSDNASASIRVETLTNPVAVDLSEDRKIVYIAESGGDSIATTSFVVSGSVNHTIVGDLPIDIKTGYNSNEVYVLNMISESLSIVDSITGDVVEIILSDCIWPSDMELDIENNRIFIACKANSKIAVIDMKSTAQSDIILSPGSSPAAMTLVASKNMLFVADSIGNRIIQIDIIDNSVADSIPSHKYPTDIFLDEINSNLYVANRGMNSVSVYSIDELEFVREIKYLFEPSRFYRDFTGTRLFVISSSDESIYQIFF